MPSSLFKIAEQCREFVPDQDIQVLIAAVQDAYAAAVKREWYENKADGVSEVDGAFLYTFEDNQPIYSLSRGMYYLSIPSSYLRLPHEMGVNWVGFMGDKTDFVRITNVALWSNLKAGLLGGRQTYMVEGVKMFFPKMTASNAGKVLLRLAIALETADVRAELNIPPNIAAAVIDMVVSRFAQPKTKE